MGSFDKLWVAAHVGNVNVLQQELDMGAPIEGRDPLGHTALMEASKYGHSNVVQVLSIDLLARQPFLLHHFCRHSNQSSF